MRTRDFIEQNRAAAQEEVRETLQALMDLTGATRVIVSTDTFYTAAAGNSVLVQVELVFGDR